MTDRKRHGLVLLLVAGLIAASVALIATRPTRLGLEPPTAQLGLL